ncbi:unnamed protein product [Vitrella brassicaformis CCMP3155]|uniref:Uncharacterized protein n=1 Tax=Vitrella brassicaformis (strain CCMP3155) TaxID=1169540 RepID=A0A0G4E875_VITBC|nr:unnamed protein product [Vitrella brassicaformis CCMP3155]|eukprot:CEL91760.1 unnamed protein product [Vitrella brassicaformis CCMP3155]
MLIQSTKTKKNSERSKRTSPTTAGSKAGSAEARDTAADAEGTMQTLLSFTALLLLAVHSLGPRWPYAWQAEGAAWDPASFLCGALVSTLNECDAAHLSTLRDSYGSPVKPGAIIRRTHGWWQKHYGIYLGRGLIGEFTQDGSSYGSSTSMQTAGTANATMVKAIERVRRSSRLPKRMTVTEKTKPGFSLLDLSLSDNATTSTNSSGAAATARLLKETCINATRDHEGQAAFISDKRLKEMARLIKAAGTDTMCTIGFLSSISYPPPMARRGAAGQNGRVRIVSLHSFASAGVWWPKVEAVTSLDTRDVADIHKRVAQWLGPLQYHSRIGNNEQWAIGVATGRFAPLAEVNWASCLLLFAPLLLLVSPWLGSGLFAALSKMGLNAVVASRATAVTAVSAAVVAGVMALNVRSILFWPPGEEAAIEAHWERMTDTMKERRPCGGGEGAVLTPVEAAFCEVVLPKRWWVFW